MRDSKSSPAQLQKVERRLEMGQREQKLARQILAVVGIEMQGLQVVAEVHHARSGRSSRKFGKRDTEAQRAEDPVLLRELIPPMFLVAITEVLEAHSIRVLRSECRVPSALSTRHAALYCDNRRRPFTISSILV